MHTSFRSRVFRTLCVVAACVLLVREAAWAQQPSGAVQGLVVDPLGARVAGAVVRLIADDDQIRTDFATSLNSALTLSMPAAFCTVPVSR